LTNDLSITCITPKCTLPACLGSASWNGIASVPLVLTLSTEFNSSVTSSNFTYDGKSTSFIITMTRTAWATGTNFLQGSFSAKSIANTKMNIGRNLAIIKANIQDTIDPYSTIYFRPYSDVVNGFLNFTLSIQEPSIYQYNFKDLRVGAAGYATLLPDNTLVLRNEFGFGHTYNFASTLTGVIYSLCILPVVSEVSPRIGSLGGGTVLTIRGHGFASDFNHTVIFAAGLPCDIISATYNLIQCQTRPCNSLPSSVYSSLVSNSNFSVSTNRGYASTGAWIKIMVSTGDTSTEFLSVPYRRSLTISFNQLLQYTSWKSTWAVDAKTTVSAEVSTLFIAPFTGTYYFGVINNGSTFTLFDSNDKVISLSSFDPNSPSVVLQRNLNQSAMVSLQRGQKYLLRAVSVSTYLFIYI